MKPEEKPWIKLPVEFPDPKRVYDLADYLNITQAHALGLIVCLWRSFIEHGPILSGFKYEAELRTNTVERLDLTEALIRFGFLDQVKGGLRVRDWLEFAFPWMLEVQRTKIKRCQYRARQAQRRSKLRGLNKNSASSVQEVGRNPYKYKHQGLRKAPVRVRERMEREMKNT